MVAPYSTRVDGSYRDRVLQLAAPAPGACDARIEWRSAFEAVRVVGTLVIGPDVGGRCPSTYPYWRIDTYEVTDLTRVP